MSLPNQEAVRPVLLRALADLGGRARPADIYPLVTGEFPEIRPEDLAFALKDGRTNRWTNRIQWARQDVVLAGVIDRSEAGVWKLTPKGEDLAQRGATSADLAPVRPPRQKKRQARSRPTQDPEPIAPADPPSLPDAAPVTVLVSWPEALVTELRAAALDSRDPNRLERAVAEAFRFLGFEAELIGGSGRTDVLIRAPLGIRRYSVVVDAKARGRGRVQEVEWFSIRDHREKERATYACLVGPDFAGGQFTARALEVQVTLLTVDELAELVSLHTETPLTLTELRAVFETVPAAKTVLPQLRAAARERGGDGAWSSGCCRTSTT